LVQKSLDEKLTRLRELPGSDDFILADAKDADMAFGLASPGRDPETGRLRSMTEYRQILREIVAAGHIDIALMSASTAELLVEEGVFADSHVTPAFRANDSTDIWLAGGTGDYGREPSLPFRSASIERMCPPGDEDDFFYDEEGELVEEEPQGVNLALYSFTANNVAELDRKSLEAYAQFREECSWAGLRHFLEVFPPNAPANLSPERIPRFVADTVVRTLAGLTRSERPLFLKIPYLGPELTELLVAYDTSMVVGIMGGPAGTTFDAFRLLEEARRHGVRAALFGRHINQAEDQVLFVQHLRWIADGELEAADGVKSYHDHLAKLGIPPQRSLEDDLAATVKTLASYGS
jgi:hypothetical protein